MQEDEIIDAQATDSAFGKLRDEFRAAEKNYQDARTSVVESDDFKAKLQAVAIRMSRRLRAGPEKGV